MNYRDRQVVVTGGTGALGTAVVSALLAAGAVCHVPYIDEQKIQRFPHRGNERVKLVARLRSLGQVGRSPALRRY